MGIRGLTKLVQNYPVPLITSVDVHNQYVLVDCRALIFNLVFHARRNGVAGNYFDYRQRLIQFFHNLDRCNIKPIMIYDGFLRVEEDGFYGLMEMKFPRSSIEIKTWNVEDHFRRKLFVMIMKQTAAELKVPWFSARPESFEDLAALSKLLKIPVWSNNTIFAPFDIDMPYLMFECFWLEEQFQPQESNGRMVIKANQFSLRKILGTFRVNEEYFSLLCILFDMKTFDRYYIFRNNNFKTEMMIPRHLRTTQNVLFRRPNPIESALIWFSRTRTPVERLVDDVIITLQDQQTVERTRKEILRKQEKYRNPKIKRNLLLKMIEKISEPEIHNLLDSALEHAVDDESEAYLDDAVLHRIYEGNFPIWVPRFLHCQASNLPFASLRDVFSIALPELESEHPILTEIPKIIYQLLFRKEKGEVKVDLYEITIDECWKANSISLYQSFSHDIDVYKSREDLNEADMDKRKDFLLTLLFPDTERRVRYKEHAANLSDDMKLTLAVTNFWVIKQNPEPAIVKAIIMMFSIMEIRKQREERLGKGALCDVLEEDGEESEKWNDREGKDRSGEDFAFERSVLLWEECFESVITLNQILNFPLPEPSLGKLYNCSTLWKLYKYICNGEDVRNKIRVEGFPELYHMMIEIVSKWPGPGASYFLLCSFTQDN